MALSKELREWACCNMLNTFLFDKVWNEPTSEYRINIKPQLVKTTSQVGSFAVIDGNVPLPTEKDAYFVWAISIEDFNIGLQLPTLEWISLVDVCNEYRTLIHMYGISGAMFHKGCTFMMYNGSRNVIFIAAKKHMVNKVIPINSIGNVYLTVYYDSDLPNDVKVLSLYTTNMKDLQQLQFDQDVFLADLKNPDYLSVYVNGVDITDADHPPMVDNLTYYDFIIDENILFSFEVELVNTNQDPVFLSEMDKTWKQIIHIPKALNPDNKIITHNTCDFTAYKKYGPVYGYYLHRASRDRTITQITHNDMAIPMFIMDAYRDYLQTQEIRLKCVVRQHVKDNVLIQDASYINLLYCDLHDDATIIKILEGKGPEQIPWWRADQLEQSEYVKMMFDTPNIISPTTMPQYVDALGFYQVVNLLCQRIQDVTISDAYTGTLTFNLPVLYTGMRVIPIVYLNGKPVERQYFGYACDTKENTVTIVMSQQLYTQVGDRLTVMLFVDGDNASFNFIPETGNLSINVPFDDCTVYMKKTGDVEYKGINYRSHDSYIKCTTGSNVYIEQKTENGCRITFNAEYSGKEFTIQSAYCSYLQSHNLAEYTKTGATLAIPVGTNIEGTVDEFVPIFDFKNISAYLNGNYLIKGLDYFVNRITDDEGNCVANELVIQTMDYFNEDGEDILDVLFNVAEIEDNSHGFSLLNRLQDESPVNLYFPNISAVHVDGKLVRDVDYRGVYILLHNDPVLNGGKFEIQTSVPQVVKDFILEYATNRDLERIKILNEYFYPFIQINVPYLVMEDKHRLYSAWINTFFHDVYTGKISLAADPDMNRMKAQLAPYEYIKDQDLVFAGLDQRFVDYYPQYVNYDISPELKLVLDRFIAVFMPKNIDPTLEVVYE